jgi:hypothetical protein
MEDENFQTTCDSSRILDKQSARQNGGNKHEVENTNVF